MTHHISESLVTGTSMLRAGLLALLFMSFSHPTALRAAPIVLQATTLTSDGCGSTISGDNFSLAGDFAMPSCVGRIAPVGIAGQSLAGILNIPENPGRFALAYGPYQPSLFKDVTPGPRDIPANFTGIYEVKNVVLSGSLQVCLARAGDRISYLSCDPQFIDFGVININVAGVARYDVFRGDPILRGFEGFFGTSAAAPEPAHLGLAAGAILLFLPFAAQQQRRRTRA